MGTFNAFAFSLLGALMGFLPALLPSYFSSSLSAGSTSELWLEFMGLVHGALGVFYVVRNEVMPLIVRVMSWRISVPRLIEQRRPGILLRPAAVGFSHRRPSRENRVAA